MRTRAASQIASARAPLGVLWALACATALTGCGQIVEANVKAVETLGRDGATEGEKAGAGIVVGGTLAVLTGLAIVGTVGAATVGGGPDVPPQVVIVDELGWGFTRAEGRATWYRCTSRLLCTHQQVSEDSADVIDIAPAGRGRPVAMGGVVGDEVDLVAVRVRRRR